MGRFQAQEPNGLAVQQLEVLVRTAVFKSANALVGFLLQEAAHRIDAGGAVSVFTGLLMMLHHSSVVPTYF